MGLSEFIAQNGFSDGLVYWFTSLFADGTAKELIVFLTSLLPVLECRGAFPEWSA